MTVTPAQAKPRLGEPNWKYSRNLLAIMSSFSLGGARICGILRLLRNGSSSDIQSWLEIVVNIGDLLFSVLLSASRLLICGHGHQPHNHTAHNLILQAF